METIINILINPITLVVTGFVIALGLLASPYDVKFEEYDED